MSCFMPGRLALAVICSLFFTGLVQAEEEELPFEPAVIETTMAEMKGNGDFSGHDNQSSFNIQDSAIFYQDPLFEMYPEYERLSRRLGSASTGEIENYARRYFGSSLAEKLTADFIEARVRARDFASALPLVRYVQNPDFSEECALAALAVHQGNRETLTRFKPRIWLRGNLPPTCKVANEELLNSGQLSRDDLTQRYFFLLRTNQLTAAGDVLTRLGGFFDRSLFNADYYGESSGTPDDLVSQGRFIYAVGRQSEVSPFQALGLVQTGGWPDYVTGAAYRTLAMSTMGKYIVSNGHLPQTLDWFKASIRYPFSDDEAAAYAQTAIRFNDFRALQDAVSRMSPARQQERIWRYWLARAHEKNMNSGEAKKMYRSLTDQDDFYGLMARLRLGQPFVLKLASFNDNAAIARAFDSQESFQRAMHLKNLPGQSQAATREWNWGVWQSRSSGKTDLLLKAATEANRLGWYDRAIFAMEKIENLNAHDLSHPAPYLDMIMSGSQTSGISPAWALGIMRQESRFVPRARSHVGASGLMQVMPATGRWIARQLGESFTPGILHDISGNIRYGTFYLGSILGQLDQNVVLATAAYNAGPGRARRWQASDVVLESDQYIETIPFTETRDYVKQVLTNAVHYDALLSRQHTVDPRTWFPNVGVKNEFR